MTNPLRNQMISRAVSRAQHGKLDITVRNVAMFLPGPTAFDPKLRAMDDFLLDADDIAPYLPQADRPQVIETVEIEDNRHEFNAAAAPAEPPQVRFERLDARSIELERERADLRVVYDTAIKAELAARHELDGVARTFMQGFGAPQTPDELLKAHATSEAETRRKIASGELPPRRRASGVGPSVLDRFMAAQRGGNPAYGGVIPDGSGQGSFVGGGGRKYSRGAAPVSQRNMLGINPKALPGSGLPMVKPPQG